MALSLAIGDNESKRLPCSRMFVMVFVRTVCLACVVGAACAVGAAQAWAETASRVPTGPASPMDVHWSFVPPRPVAVPNVQEATWPATSLDYFVLAHRERLGLPSAGDATPLTLLRRMCSS